MLKKFSYDFVKYGKVWLMQHTIFYSWQSDLPGNTTRNFIEDALEKAVKAMSKDEAVKLDVLIDRDTQGTYGSAEIANTIFEKIGQADVFVCDTSFINPLRQNSWINRLVLGNVASPRLTPNPNVLIELGWAAAKLGWDKILLVHNTFYGPIEALPFDLRGRKVISYYLSPETDKPAARKDLIGKLKSSLTPMLHPETWIGRTKSCWFGNWEQEKYTGSAGSIFIPQISREGFYFRMSVVDGMHMGSIAGYAQFTGPNSAYARVPNGESYGELKFRRDSETSRTIEVEEGPGCTHFHGAGVGFDGSFHHEMNVLFEYGFLEETDLEKLYFLTGQFYDDVMGSLSVISDSENMDTFTAKVLTGALRGMFMTREAIVMKNTIGELWVAYLKDDEIRYFTSHPDYKTTMPKTFENWRSRFLEAKVILSPDVRPTPDYLLSD